MVKVIIEQGTLKGKTSKTPDGFEYNEFIQIPYAKPPLGELRFKSPQAPEKFKEERDVSHSNENLISLQFNATLKEAVGSEDCLYLNVYTPALPTNVSKLLPVMVYIHGGAFVVGNGTLSKDCNPNYFIDKDVVIVTINYRLGVLGFLSLDIPEAAGNMGLKDQVMALKWIQNNIASFGGDSKNVTLFGISAGAVAIEYIMYSPLSKGLFHKAIIQSGSAISPLSINNDIKALSVNVALELGYQGSDNNNKSIHEFLMKQSMDALLEANKVTNYTNIKGLYFGFVPSIEKDFGNGDAFLTEYPYDIMKQGKYIKVPVIRGYCEFEGLLMEALKPDDLQELIERKNFSDYLNYQFNVTDNDRMNEKFKEVYLNKEKDDMKDEQFAIDFFGDYYFSKAADITNAVMVSHEVPIYGYIFAYDGGVNFSKLVFGCKQKGACHGDDLSYTMNIEIPLGIKPTKNDILIRERITKMWSDFAKSGNPTPTTSDLIPINWPALDNNGSKYLIIDKDLYLKTPIVSKKVLLFEEIYETYHN